MSEVTKEKEIQDLKDVFSMFDKDGDGTITAEELHRVLQTMGKDHSYERVVEMLNEVDADGNGMIEFDEFVTIMDGQKTTCINQDDEILESFRVFDRDGKGYITPQELRQAMFSLGVEVTDEELTQMIQEADIDGDGRIDYQEFALMMKNS